MTRMKQHPIIGERLCGELRSLDRRVRPIIRHQSRAPRRHRLPRRAERTTPSAARADHRRRRHDSTRSRPRGRTGRRGSTELACEELLVGVKHNHFRPDLVEAFVEMGRSGELEAIAKSVNVPGLDPGPALQLGELGLREVPHGRTVLGQQALGCGGRPIRGFGFRPVPQTVGAQPEQVLHGAVGDATSLPEASRSAARSWHRSRLRRARARAARFKRITASSVGSVGASSRDRSATRMALTSSD
mgnify:CR=1 FL=1